MMFLIEICTMPPKKATDKVVPAKEQVYLEGPRSKTAEFLFALKVFRQFIKGFRTLHFVGPCITVFGSARFKEDHQYYKAAYEFGKRIAELGLSTLTGGGPGIMEAANRGAYEHGGPSIGCNIKLPFEQKPNPYLHKSITFDHFFVRKTLLIKYSYAFIIMPGGFGTLDEFFETLTLIQTKTITQFPVVVYGKEYHQPLVDQLKFMAEQGTIAAEDLKLVVVTDDMDEAMAHIKTYLDKNLEMKKRIEKPLPATKKIISKAHKEQS
jgi:uncharacterized protein (TIGR00730 family)